MPIFAPKYLSTHPFDLGRIPDLDQRVAALTQWQANLRSGRVHKAKEEALQADFLNLIFGQVLGYDYQDSHLWYLEKEQKSSTDGTKADGALGYFRQLAGQRTADVRVVIELKDARADLDKPQNRAADRRTPVEQAFSYASKVGGRCRWVLVSNFVELRLYPATDQSQYESFDLGTLPNSHTELARFFRLLLRDQLLAETGESPTDYLYRERQAQEREISENFYSEYKQARLDLLAHLREQNPTLPDLLLFNKAQKLLDRVVFVCFCEDKTIIPPLTFRGLLKAVHEDKFNRSESRIYERVKGLFRAIDEGFPDAGINKFNGGLFAPDADLDNLRILDAILEPIIALEIYDFDSDLNVNILGHIFEQSIADIEELKAQLTAAASGAALLPTIVPSANQRKKLSKRKKDGIFYTPEYITRYMVREAVGGWLHQRYQAAGIEALPELPTDELTPQGQPLPTLPASRKGTLTKLLSRHTEAWQQYRQALLDIRVLDPACGSGAFLNQVFDYLHQEGQRVNRELARLSGGQTNVFDLDKHILTHNLFGVDLNDESVEITRLSLWLKTANRYQPLTTLDANIRTGDSLIRDPAVAGELAFDWAAEFPEIMGGGGFDVVIGNPPYVRPRTMSEAQKAYLISQFVVANNQFDLYQLFVEQAIDLTKEAGKISFIVPNAFLSNNNSLPLRTVILDNLGIEQIIACPQNVFADASVESLIFLFAKSLPAVPGAYFELIAGEATYRSSFNQTAFNSTANKNFTIAISASAAVVIDKIKSSTQRLDQDFSVISGIKEYQVGKGRPAQTAQQKAASVFNAAFAKDATFLPELRGKHLLRYGLQWKDEYVSYGPWLAEPREAHHFAGEKIIIRQIPGRIHLIVSYTTSHFIVDQSAYIIKRKEESSVSAKFALGILNSTLTAWFFRNENQEFDLLFPKIKAGEIKALPIPNILPAAQQPFIDVVDRLLNLTAQMQQKRQQFLALLAAELGIVSPSRKLQNWDELNWEAYVGELRKAKVDLNLTQRAEWLPLFQQRQHDMQDLVKLASDLDSALDKQVYTFYNLTQDEIALIEGK